MRVIQYGLGPVGLQITRFLHQRPSYEIVAAIDVDPAKVGHDLGVLAGLEEPLGVTVRADASAVLADTEAEAVVLTTVSQLRAIAPQVLEIVARGKNVVSTCEELTYPWPTAPELSRELDAAARASGVSILATGVNPGFLMDFLPLALSGICQQIEAIHVERIQDAQFRRLPFQQKIGAGLSAEEFQQQVASGRLRHVGLTESIHLLAAGLGWEMERTDESIEPVIASREVATESMRIPAGRVLGVTQMGRGYKDGGEVIRLVFRAAIGEPEPQDRIIIRGTPSLQTTITAGVNGDVATAAIIVNAVPTLVAAPPGLRTMVDVGLVHWHHG